MAQSPPHLPGAHPTSQDPVVGRATPVPECVLTSVLTTPKRDLRD